MRGLMLLWCCLLPSVGMAQQLVDNAPVKFAFYSSAWGENAVAGLRVVAENQQDFPIRLQSIAFSRAGEQPQLIQLNLSVPAHGYAETELPYADLLAGDDCVAETMADNWRLVEISNYTLNPSVRSLIIEDTSAFRIYQCVRRVETRWIRQDSAAAVNQYEEWVLYHFERRLER